VLASLSLSPFCGLCVSRPRKRISSIFFQFSIRLGGAAGGQCCSQLHYPCILGLQAYLQLTCGPKWHLMGWANFEQGLTRPRKMASHPCDPVTIPFFFEFFSDTCISKKRKNHRTKKRHCQCESEAQSTFSSKCQAATSPLASGEE
jgi:hypothetical protein